uniref:hypothetical protein n=1 Tax=Stappia sp. TaxID=1870903 RepID=UPI003BA94776
MPARSTALSDRLAGLVELHGPGGSLGKARGRAALTRAIYENFEALRPILIAGGSGKPIGSPSGAVRAWCEEAVDHDVLRRKGQGYRAAGNGARTYLAGAWLEELMALALLACGCRNVRFAQQVRWRAPGQEEEHFNEVDAIALHDERLVIVSCKATATDLLERSHGEERLFHAMLELSYWNAHFAAREALPVFVTTTDFFDEEAGVFRSPKLMERARVLGLTVLTADFSLSERLFARLRRALGDAAPPD